MFQGDKVARIEGITCVHTYEVNANNQKQYSFSYTCLRVSANVSVWGLPFHSYHHFYNLLLLFASATPATILPRLPMLLLLSYTHSYHYYFQDRSFYFDWYTTPTVLLLLVLSLIRLLITLLLASLLLLLLSLSL